MGAALNLGAGAIAMGSRFIASKEAEFHDNYKNVIPPAKAQDTILVTGSLGIIRLWKNKYALSHDRVASKEEKMAQESATSLKEALEAGKKYDMAYAGNVEDGAVLLGQSIGIINSVENTTDIIDTIVKDAEKYIQKVSAYVK